MYILGISAYYHDSAACLVKDGDIVSAAQEERFTRKKHDDSFPKEAVMYCLREAGITIDDIDYISFYEKPFLKFERIIETYLSYAPYGISSFLKAIPLWLKKKLWMKNDIRKQTGFKGKIIFPEHHQSHAGSAFFPSPFQSSAFLTLDGVGEMATSSYGIGHDNKIEIISEINFPHSLGMLYSAFTYYIGFKVNSGEYKVMGLAPYGKAIYVEIIMKELVDLKEDGSFHLNMNYFNFTRGLTMTNSKFNKLFGGLPRKPESPLTQREMDIAKSLQEVTDIIVLKMARHIRNETGQSNLVMAGGVALNCVTNGKLLKEKIFDSIWIQPAAGDAGGALGAALLVWYQYLDKPRLSDGVHDFMKGSYLGPQYSDIEIERFLLDKSILHEKLDNKKITSKVADLINDEKVVGWFQGRMEFGPRALGSRSIIGDARSSKMQDEMNIKIKFRESFRPFAPSILKEKASEYFEIDRDSPYMLFVANVSNSKRMEVPKGKIDLFGIDLLNFKRSTIPAVTHVDYSARIQTVDRFTNPLFYDLLEEMDKKYSCPLIINTSFNVRGEPIVCSLEDAYRCFMRTNIDYLVLGSFLIDKKDMQSTTDLVDWKKEFVLD